MLKISVIIPIYNSKKFLGKLFKSILEQNLENDKFEVVFVDNNSSDGSERMIKEFITKNKNYNFKYLFYDNKQSSYAARNFGVENCEGNVLAFTDSDCVLSQNWLLNIYNEVKKDDNKIISGNIELFIKDEENIWENFDKIVHMRNDLKIKKNEIATANMVVSKEVFLDIGFFDEVKSGGDFNWAKTAVKEGYKIVFKPDIIVFHPTRKNYNEIRKKLLRLAYGEGELYKKRKKTFVLGLIKSILRLIYIPKHIKISKKMLRNISFTKILKCNFLYLKLKLEQINFFIKGYMEG
jgi:glycosyltransferase involved in cell wall biosynthesis